MIKTTGEPERTVPNPMFAADETVAVSGDEIMVPSPAKIGGGPLLGGKGGCIIGHGNFKGHGVANGIRAVGELIREQLNEHIVEAVHQCAFESIG